LNLSLKNSEKASVRFTKFVNVGNFEVGVLFSNEFKVDHNFLGFPCKLEMVFL
jgi:hypothetical protein